MSAKDNIRQKMLALRNSQGKVETESNSRKIKVWLFSLEVFSSAGTVSFYLSTETEVQTDEMVKETLAIGKKVVVPYIVARHGIMSFSELTDPDAELVPGPYTIRQPRKKYLRPTPLDRVELVIVPGLAFDTRGHRLGFGKGFYDKMLAQKKEGTSCVGLAFRFQVMDNLPAFSHDVPMDFIITEQGIIRIGEKGTE